LITCRKRYIPLGPQRVREVFSEKLQSKLTRKKTEVRRRILIKSSSLDLNSSTKGVDADLEMNTEYVPYREELLDS